MNSFKRRPGYAGKWLWFGRLIYGLRAIYRHFRISRIATAILGTQYKRSRKLIEIDRTYKCNLHCLNCNRSCSQAPEDMYISLERIQQFVDESIALEHRWQRIRVLGGEPTLHPQFHEIIECLLSYRCCDQDCLIEVVTNGYGDEVKAALNRLPKDVWVENSHKTGPVQDDFGLFNLAPCDDAKFAHADYRNGCAIMEECGMGLTPIGFYPCAISGGIDRVAGWRIGYEHLPNPDDDMEDLLEVCCALCGRFRAGHFVPKSLRPKLLKSEISPSWVKLYEEWQEGR